MATTSNDEEIIEKKPAAPMATACLILAALATVGAMAFQVSEIAEYRKAGISNLDKPNPGELAAKKDIASIKSQVEEILNGTAGIAGTPEGDVTPRPEEGTEPDAGADADVDTDTGDDAAGGADADADADAPATEEEGQ